MAGTNFSDLISSLHSNAALQDIASDTNIITINDKRQFIPGSDFNTIIAYEGDINSQIITFRCVTTQDGHNLSACDYKELKWKNKASGIEGVSKLLSTDSPVDNSFDMTWEVPSDACTQAGTLEISVTIYDKTNNQVVFSWNTAKYTGLTIGGSLESVGFEFPPKDEILVVDRDTKSILAPIGYNDIICNHGEVGMGEIYFLVNRYLGKNREMDVMNELTDISIHYIIDDTTHYKDDKTSNRIEKKLYTAEINNRNSEGLVFIKWTVPDFVTSGTAKPEDIKVAISIHSNSKTWYSNTYSNLKIGDNVFRVVDSENDIPESLEEHITEIMDSYLSGNEFIIDGNAFSITFTGNEIPESLEQYIREVIDNYFSDNEFIIYSN